MEKLKKELQERIKKIKEEGYLNPYKCGQIDALEDLLQSLSQPTKAKGLKALLTDSR